MTTSSTSQYWSLRDRGSALIREGRMEAAAEQFEQAYRIARQLGDQGLLDRALCNWVGVLITLQNCDAHLPRLREILTRNSDVETCRLAAYHLANAYEAKRENRKGLFYARIALEHTKVGGQPDWMISSHNQLGNFLVAESFFDEALEHYRAALEFPAERSEHDQAMIVGNIGYCHLMLGDPRAALELLYRSWRVLRRASVSGIRSRLDLSLALLEVGKLRHALRHAACALDAAQAASRQDGAGWQDAASWQDDIKNALYLMGEAAHLLGDEDLARSYFQQLQTFYPDNPYLTDFLLATDIRQMVNLRA